MVPASWPAVKKPLPPPLLQESGQRAREWTHRIVELGPRSIGSVAHQKLQNMINTTITPLAEGTGGSLELFNFTAQTPIGKVPMTNIIAKFPGTSDRTVIVSGHYDTYQRNGLNFVGANDSGSSAGFLIALAELLANRKQSFHQVPNSSLRTATVEEKIQKIARRPRNNTIWIVFFDGEESFVKWSPTDGIYGSKQLAEDWAKDGSIHRLQALINIDMIGDQDLTILPEGQSTPWLRRLVIDVAERLGYSSEFPRKPLRYVTDDHVPFVQSGASAVNLIDFQFGPENSYWHTSEDTLDKLSPRSFSVVMHVILEMLSELDRAP